LSVCLGLALASIVLGKVIVMNIIINAIGRLATKSDNGPRKWLLLRVYMLKKSVAARKDIANANMDLDIFIKAKYGPLYSINDP
jgi:hypothetical protein